MASPLDFVADPARSLLYGAHLQQQYLALRSLPGFAELRVPQHLAARISHKRVPARPLPSLANEGLEGPAPRQGPLRQGWVPGQDEADLSSAELRENSHGRDSAQLGNGNAQENNKLRNATQDEAESPSPGRPTLESATMQPVVRSWLFRTDRLRRVRFTYVDGGAALQAFNSLCYPDGRYDLPLLGVDLLAFGSSKLLCVIDFQPVKEAHAVPRAVLQKRQALRYLYGGTFFQAVSSRFFKDTRFFSPDMVVFRSERGWDEPHVQVPCGQLAHVLEDSLGLYHEMLHSSLPLQNQAQIQEVMRGQREYDEYFKATDPALPMFSAYFGEDWSEDYCDGFLFPLASGALLPASTS